MTLKKITEQEMNAQGVCAAPNILNGTPAENKSIFDRMVRSLVAPAINACVDAVEEVNQNQVDWEQQEQARETGEQGRVTAEVQRAAAEQQRANAEAQRVDAEAARGGAETARQTAEAERQSAEVQRTMEENGRADAEAVRQAAEAARQTQEQARAAEEQRRYNAEVDRVEAEDLRASAEAEREAAEISRGGAETARANAETRRQAQSDAMAVWEDYNATKAYAPLNKVAWQGSSYICIRACKGVTPDNGTYWLMIARRGLDGAAVTANGMFGFSVEDGHLILHYTGDNPPDFSINAAGHLILNLDDANTLDLGQVTGGGIADDKLSDTSESPVQNKVIKSALDALSEEIANISGGGSGLSPDAKNLLISILRNAHYDSDQSDNITALESALASIAGGNEGNPPAVIYTVTNNLTNVTTSNNETQATENTAYTASLTASDGYAMEAVTVSMGGVDVTDAVYVNGYITISNVTGDVIITATAELSTVNSEELTSTSVTGWPEPDSDGVWAYTELAGCTAQYRMFLPGELYGGTIKLEWDTEECSGFDFSIRTMTADGKAAHTSTGNAASDGTINWVVAGNRASTGVTTVSSTIISLPEGERAYVVTRRGNRTGALVTSNAEYNAWVATGGLKCTVTK